MSSYAVIKIAGTQYKVSEGDELKVTLPPLGEEKTLSFEEVLLVADGGKIQIGQPKLAGFKVTAKVIGEVKGKKVRTAIFKAKAHYRKVKGFRPSLTHLRIEKISSPKVK